MSSGIFQAWWDALGRIEAIPGLPYNCRLTANSKVDPSQRGKIPGMYSGREDAWYGMPDWATAEFHAEDVRKWDSYPATPEMHPNVCVRARHFPAADLDIEHIPFRDRVVAAIVELTGQSDLLIRTREGSNRMLIPFRLEPGTQTINKLRIAAAFPGVEGEQLFELLGAGQQWLAAGVHPSGKRYAWKDGVTVFTYGVEVLPLVTLGTVLELFNRIEAIIADMGGTITKSSRNTSALSTGPALDVADPSFRPDPQFVSGADMVAALSVLKIDELDYDGWMRAMHAYKAAGGEFKDFYHACSKVPGNSIEVVQGKWDSISTSQVGWEHIRREARTAGWDDPTPADFDDDIPAETPEEIKKAAEAKKQGVTWERAIEAVERSKGEREKPELIEDILDHAAISVIYGDSNVGKTFVVLDIAHCIATGRKWYEHDTEPGLVVYVAAEGQGAIRKRFESLSLSYPDTPDPPLVLIPHTINLADGVDGLNALLNNLKEIQAAYNRPIKGIMFDTVAAGLAGANENSSEGMGKFIENIKLLKEKTRAHVCLVHHSGKDAARGARGWSGLRAAVDTEIEITPGRITITKQRDKEARKPIPFRLKSVDLGTNRKGKMIKSCIVEYVEDTNTDEQQRVEDLSAIARLRDIVTGHGFKLKEGGWRMKRGKVVEVLVEADKDKIGAISNKAWNHRIDKLLPIDTAKRIEAAEFGQWVKIEQVQVGTQRAIEVLPAVEHEVAEEA